MGEYVYERLVLWGSMFMRGEYFGMEILGEEYAYFVCLVSWSIFGFREYLLKKGGGYFDGVCLQKGSILGECIYNREYP